MSLLEFLSFTLRYFGIITETIQVKDIAVIEFYFKFYIVNVANTLWDVI